MICVHTVRRLKPGAFDRFAHAFRPGGVRARPDWARFTMLRGIDDPDEVVTFGFFDGTVEEMRASQRDETYQQRIQDTAAFVDEVISTGVYAIAIDADAPARSSTLNP